MKKILIAAVAALIVAPAFATTEPAAATAPVKGFWKTIDDKTGNAKSIVRLYDCGDNLCGRVVAIFNPEGTAIAETLSNPAKVAEEVKGKPKMVGLDIIWDMKLDGDEFRGGKILDPKSGSVYSSVIWQTKEDRDFNQLQVRGKIGPFGRTQMWLAMDAKDLPKDLKNLDVSKWTPVFVK
ncbi:MAG: DUF2147 domain-containing protein [Rickettsiales bacterium]|jgi:uncharacterized protein (DUF2147 family)|nr:DUF2147 domain-containing protein [Rickettsiales bacterium]